MPSVLTKSPAFAWQTIDYIKIVVIDWRKVIQSNPMTRELILMRHAHAQLADLGQLDHTRALSPQGCIQAKAAGRWLMKHSLFPDRILCSQARRARETLAAMIASLGESKPLFEPNIYQASVQSLITVLDAHVEADRVLLIGHNPSLEQLCRLLCHQQQTFPVVWSISPSSLVVLTLSAKADRIVGGADLKMIWKP